MCVCVCVFVLCVCVCVCVYIRYLYIFCLNRSACSAYVCACACVRACVGACARACVYACILSQCVHAYESSRLYLSSVKRDVFKQVSGMTTPIWQASHSHF